MLTLQLLYLQLVQGLGGMLRIYLIDLSTSLKQKVLIFIVCKQCQTYLNHVKAKTTKVYNSSLLEEKLFLLTSNNVFYLKYHCLYAEHVGIASQLN